MLQQTQVDRVVPTFEAFVDAFPDFAALAARVARRRAARVEGARVQLARGAPAAASRRPSSNVTAARCQRARRSCARCRASARTRPRRSAPSPSISTTRRSTRTCGASCNRLFFGLEYPRGAQRARTRRTRARARCRRPRARLELGADGSRRDDLHGARAEMPALSAARRLRGGARSTPPCSSGCARPAANAGTPRQRIPFERRRATRAGASSTVCATCRPGERISLLDLHRARSRRSRAQRRGG